MRPTFAGSAGLTLAASTLLVVALTLFVGFAQQQTSTATPKFEVASIKPCRTGDLPPGGRSGGGNFSTSPGRLSIRCMTVENLINISFRNGNDSLLNDTSRPNSTFERVRGGPAWVRSDQYTIDATAEGTRDTKLLLGLMLQALLVDRFGLKTHRETEEVPMYTLTVGRIGLKLKPMEDGGCIPFDPNNRPTSFFASGAKLICGLIQDTGSGMDAGGVSLSRLAAWLSNTLDRHVFDKTGITGVFNIHLEFARDDSVRPLLPGGTPPPPLPDAADGPSIFTALQQQLGLKLEQAKGPREYLVIDHVEKPSEN
jgi:uncharacterized protein (TIGR03435 family)